jgi:hypothetical protein
MSVVTTLECFIASGKTHEVFTIILHTSEVTQTTNLPKPKPKQIFYIGCDQLIPRMAIVLSIYAWHLGKVVNI